MVAATFSKTARNCWGSTIFFLLTTRGLLSGIYQAAKAGRLLPSLTLTIPFHVIAHKCIFLGSVYYDDGSEPVANIYSRRTSLYLLIVNLWLNVVGYAFLVLMYRHSIHTIFNRNVPRRSTDDDGCTMPSPHPALESFNTHLLLLRPLEILFRFITAPLRVLPDVIILGETRCGTTNLCGHIVSLSSTSSQAADDPVKIKCYTPFCAWNVPELDHKESFYFVGHYLGIVDPYFYRMAFPLKITRWWEEHVLGNIFFCFDGCAQYLSSPTAPYLIASAYRNSPPPVLVACVRKPVDQAVSWWQYENNAMAWGERMGLKEWNTTLRSESYPPKTIIEALEFSKSEFVQNAYANAEIWGRNCLQQHCIGDVSNVFNRFIGLCSKGIKRLPPWAVTWPAGQLSTIGRSGNYLENICRYNSVFMAVSQISVNSDKQATTSTKNKIGLVHVVPIECQSDGSALKMAILLLFSEVIYNCVTRRKLTTYKTLMTRVENAIDSLCTEHDFELAHHRNSSASLSISEFVPSNEDLQVLGEHLEAESHWYSSNAKKQWGFVEEEKRQ